jgi:hypothetical protein
LVGATQIGRGALLLSLPIVHLRLGGGDAGLLPIACGAPCSVVQRGQKLTGFDVISNLYVDFDNAAGALGSDIGLLLCDQRPGRREGPGIRRN